MGKSDSRPRWPRDWPVTSVRKYHQFSNRKATIRKHLFLNYFSNKKVIVTPVGARPSRFILLSLIQRVSRFCSAAADDCVLISPGCFVKDSPRCPPASYLSRRKCPAPPRSRDADANPGDFRPQSAVHGIHQLVATHRPIRSLIKTLK